MNKSFRQLGFSTLEVLIAVAILVLALTAVVGVSFINQSLVSDNQTSEEALNKAQALLEKEQALVFSVVGTQAGIDDGTVLTDGIYQTRVQVITPWKLDGVTDDADVKKIIATVSWTGDHNRAESTQLSALVTNYKR